LVVGLLTLLKVLSASAADLTVVVPKKGQPLNLGGSLVIRANKAQALAIVQEVSKGEANRRMGLYLNGIGIPGLRHGYRVLSETAELLAVHDVLVAEVARSGDKPAPGLTNWLAKVKADLELKSSVEVSFTIERFSHEATSRSAWDALLRPQTEGIFPVSVDLAVGTRSPVPVEGPGGEGTLLMQVSARLAWAYAIALVCLLLSGLLVYFHSEMLREGGDSQNAFSLARTQMAFWGLLVLVCFVGVAVACGSLEHIPEQSLVLMGISAATGLSASVIDKGVTQNRKSAGSSFKGFFADICRGDQGASFHRVQLLLWTLVLGVYFAWNVAQMISMPEFPNTLLVLMGISNGTYLGFKIRENSPEKNEVAR